MTQYFKNCKTEEEAKKLFRKLAKKLHPDHGGSNEEMIELQKQFDNFSEDDHDSYKSYENKHSYYQQNTRFYGSGYGYTSGAGYSDTGGAAYNKSDLGGSGKAGTGGAGFGFNSINDEFKQRMNSNPFNQSTWGLPFDHPAIQAVNNLKNQIRVMENDYFNIKLKTSNLELNYNAVINELIAAKAANDLLKEEIKELKKKSKTRKNKYRRIILNN